MPEVSPTGGGGASRSRTLAALDQQRSHLLAGAMFMAGCFYPAFYRLTPADTFNPLWVWFGLAAAMMLPGALALALPTTRRHLPGMTYAVLGLLTAHFMGLAAFNDLHPFYGAGAVMMTGSCALAFSRPRSLMIYGIYAATLFALAASMTSWEAKYYVPIGVLLALAYWHLTERARIEARLEEGRGQLERMVEDRTQTLLARSRELAEANEHLSREIRNRESAEERLQVWQRLESVGRLAGGVAHDFNNLLTTISGYGELIRSSLPEGSPLREDAAEICAAAERATGLTHQLLAFTGDASIEGESIDVNELLRDSQSMIHAVACEDVQVVLKFATSRPRIWANRVQFGQIITNLAANARDAMPEGGVLAIEVDSLRRHDVAPGALPVEWQADSIVALRVRDTGVGIDEETIQHIFDPFFTTKGVGKGTGLGLAAVYGIVQQGGGAIQVESRPGSGTCFTVYWPQDLSDEATAGPAQLRGLQRGDEGARGAVLVVDDEESILNLSARILERSGFHVVSVSSAEQALETLRKSADEFDVVLTDVVLPGRSGIELYNETRTLAPELPVLFMSGHLTHPSLTRNELPPSATLLAKPFTADALVAQVRSAVEGSDEKLNPSDFAATPSIPPRS